MFTLAIEIDAMIFVTGATGLVGSHLLVKLLQDKQPIRALYRIEKKLEQAQKIIQHYLSKDELHLLDQIEWIQGSINDIPLLENAFEGITHVYHCAAWISFDPKNYKKLRKVNIRGTANIVNFCIKNKVQKLCYVSSIAAIGKDVNKEIIDESAEWYPEATDSVYAITKYGAEMEVWRGTQEGLDAVIVNPGVIIGPGFFQSGSGSLFTQVHKGLNHYPIGITGYIGIHDVVDIMQQLMKKNIKNERYILVAENLSFKNLFTMIAIALDKNPPQKKVSRKLLNVIRILQWLGKSIFGTKQFIFKSSVHSAFEISHYDNTKIKTTLDYKFASIEETINETATLFPG